MNNRESGCVCGGLNFNDQARNSSYITPCMSHYSMLPAIHKPEINMDEINKVIDPREVASQKNIAVAVNGRNIIYSINTELV